MTGDAPERSDGRVVKPSGKDLPTPSEIARDAAMEAAAALKTANQLPMKTVGEDQSSLLYPPPTPRRRR